MGRAHSLQILFQGAKLHKIPEKLISVWSTDLFGMPDLLWDSYMAGSVGFDISVGLPDIPVSASAAVFVLAAPPPEEGIPGSVAIYSDGFEIGADY